ncbi:nucleolar pre ribosomal associated protein [Echinococcus multilocularis]|uniref:Nucleolar pre ribosomal associated protein n=1 Tax=Echinococcus multilocularis TaxID=6211 RepID=A0A068Y0H9_ECHMU|nr:nucleolar pre ribosomal associated protein [Echinococcus multilocularis]
MVKNHKIPSVEFDVPPKRHKTSRFSELTSDPTSLAFFLKKIETEEEDIVKEYLSESSGEELLLLLETGYERKSNELAVILKVLATIIVRARTDLTDLFADTGRRLAEGVLEDAPLAACLRALKPQSSAEAAKASLQLLAAVVSTDPVFLGRSLVRSVDFEHPDWVQVSRRRNIKDSTDVRTCFINFIASFLVSNNNLLIRELLESKNSITLLISECFTDKPQNVLLILTLLRTSICENATVSKTIRMRIFTRAALKQLAYLYAYRGEALSKKVALSRSDAEVDAHSVELVRQALHRLLLPLTSSPLTGLVFRERAYLEAGKQNEHLLSFLFSPPMDSAFTDEMRRELVANCLLACPALLPAYLTHWTASMVPRDSENWHNLMAFVNQLFSMFQNHLVNRVSQLLELSQDMAQFVQGLSDICLPPLGIAEVLHSAFQHESKSVTKAANTIYRTLRQNLVLFLTWLHTTEELKTKGATPKPIIQSISKILLERVLVDKWLQRFSKTLQKEHTDVSLLEDQILPPTEEQEEEVEGKDEESEGLRSLISTSFFVDSKKVSSPEAVIATLSKKFRSRLLMLHKLSQNPETEVTERELVKLLKIWPQLAPTCLKTYWHHAVVLNCMAAAVRLLSQSISKSGWMEGEKNEFVSEKISPCPKHLLKLISTNRVFKLILLEKPLNEEFATVPLTPLKTALVNLLLALAEVDPKITAAEIPLLSILAAYRSSLSVCDRFLLQLIYILDLGGYSISSIWGMSTQSVIWGDRLADHYRFGETLGEAPQLWRELNPGAFLNVLDKDKLLSSALSFPVTRRCLARSMNVECVNLDHNHYDPCFLLPLFLQYLSSDEAQEELQPSRVDIRGFYTRNCLAFVVGALSSYSRNIRGLAKSIIARFRLLSEAWKPTKTPSIPMSVAVMKQFPERVQLNFMLDTLRNSLSTKAGELGGGPRRAVLFGSRADTSFRLSRVHANFFIHSLGMLTKPEHRMYEVFWNTYMAKPAIDLGTVPDFMRIMYSVHKDFRVERQWMVKLCADSLNDTSDYLLLEKSRVYKYCLLLYADPGVDTTTQIQILRLLTATTRIPRACHALTRFHAFPLWLFRHALSTAHSPSLCYFFTIISQMIAAFEETKEASPCLSMLRLLDTTFRKMHDESTFNKRRIKRITA